ncbi:Sodium/calcium exchanger membrane region [Lasallia pustulata]|uniref:Sodium/calcium exchanger membrane region n=1 Tax=Lasallia pustulata TaxID=136370 RepID=A0A1W5D7B1_9LECA|nr:Sodium/calcium exchanger membrane region [Lasallia pustulata]
MRSAKASKKPLRQHGLPTYRRQKYSGRAFYLTVLVISIIAAFSLVIHKRQPGVRGGDDGSLRQRDSSSFAVVADAAVLMRRDQGCRLVNTVDDKCAFIRANCPDEEAGLFSYLQLYYCNLHHAKPIAFTILVLWLSLLFSTIGIAASDFFCINLSTIASILGMSESMAGVTFLAFGNGSPDVFSTFAAMSTNSGSLAVGELIGAAGFITAVVAGSMALVRPFRVARKSFIRDVGFFVVAASFSMVFLADGYLHLWECAVMVGFYVFYVIVVVVWHWYLGQRRRRREREAAARGHFNIPGTGELEVEEENGDDEDAAPGDRRGYLSRNSTQDFAALERGGTQLATGLDEDEDDETRDRWLAEISSNMRVSRLRRGERRNTVNPIRPSLVGALEFRSVLSSLQRSRNIQTIPINLRRYSDDPTYTAAQRPYHLQSISESGLDGTGTNLLEVDSTDGLRSSIDSDRSAAAKRTRAVSANDVTSLRLDSSALQRPAVPQIDLLSASPPESPRLEGPGEVGGRKGTTSKVEAPLSSNLSVASSPGGLASRESSPASLRRRPSPDLLAPPGEWASSMSTSRDHNTEPYHDIVESPEHSPRLAASRNVPRISIPHRQWSKGSSPASPFPQYFDEPAHSALSSRPPSIRLPPPSLGSESLYPQQAYEEYDEKPVRWWPYKILPTPRILVSTLFPTLYSWHDKNIWDKFLGIASAPSVFLLAITLPVVEAESGDESEVVGVDHGFLTPQGAHSRSRSHSVAILPPDSPSIGPTDSHFEDPGQQPPNSGRHANHGLGSPVTKGVESRGDNATIAGSTEPLQPHSPTKPPALPLGQDLTQTPSLQNPTVSPPSSPKEWNRWLVSTQVFTAPFFIVLLVWANTDPDRSPRNLILPTLYTLIGSLATFGIILLTTSASKPPRYRFLLCFVGFVVSIGWISTIANEVVGVLKAFGVILGISDAILGLTIFAVGNSLGDLVADITVARLGYPVMALSACFGGPMLNILLGIGISGLYMMTRDGNGRHHRLPSKPVKYEPYQIEVGGTLMISGVTLLVTLVGLLVVVPANGWKMDRRIGWGLVTLWSVSTVLNVLVEVTGVAGDLG